MSGLVNIIGLSKANDVIIGKMQDAVAAHLQNAPVHAHDFKWPGQPALT
ncbi:MAG: hypothetical protein KDK62_01165 [Chlamydiia bacterium]|nr:hypothetical protein [Chlamydiia bacterium]